MKTFIPLSGLCSEVPLPSAGDLTHPHAEDQETHLLHQRVLSDLLLSLLLGGKRVVALLAQLHIHDARLHKASCNVLQLQVQVCGTTWAAKRLMANLAVGVLISDSAKKQLSLYGNIHLFF